MPDRPRPPLLLVLALLALPQVAETILSPALPALASHWRLDDATSQWTMALFFVGFAPGIWLWGWLADRLGRRPALLGGLGLAALATFGAWASTDYSYLLACRLVQGLGLATCSVTVQASLRDVLQGPALMSYFVTLGAVLAWSPAVGPLGGQWLADLGGHPAVFATLAVLLASLAALVVPAWPETRPLLAGTPEPAPLAIFRRVLADRPLQTRALLVAVLNVLVFSFYAAGPFMVGDLPGLGLDIPLGPLALATDDVRDEDWENNWKQYYKPFPVGERLLVRPVWEPSEGGDRLELVMEPGMAFGTGTHETTFLCLELLQGVVGSGDLVWDIGCGTGILGVAAVLLGAGQVVAVDRDPVAVSAARINGDLNQTGERLDVRQGDLLKGLVGTPRVIVANIIAEVVAGMAADAYASLTPGGAFLCSGIILAREELVRDALESAGFTVTDVRHMGEWVAMLACKP